MHVKDRKKASHPTFSLKTKKKSQYYLFPLGLFAASMKLECNNKRAISAARPPLSVCVISFMRSQRLGSYTSQYFIQDHYYSISLP